MKILDLIEPHRSDIRYKRFSFPDGQPHFELLEPGDIPHGARVEILSRIKSAADIADVGMAVDTLLASSLAFDRINSGITLNIAYMLGARMDRRIGPRQPLTLDVLAGMLATAANGVDRIRVLDPHSRATPMAFLKAGYVTAAIYPDRLIQLALQDFGSGATIVIPDEGAIERTTAIVGRLGLPNPIARCVKKRDSATGMLSGFALVDGNVIGNDCLIVDDLCDGGGTFSGIATVLREAGARSVALCVTHGIFSKGLTIAGIDTSYCTDSYARLESHWGLIAERGESGFLTLREPDTGRVVLHVLTDFLRDHVLGMETAP